MDRRIVLINAIVVFVIFFRIAPSWAQTIQDLGEELNSLIAEAPELNKAMSQTTDENTRLYKEYALYVDDQKRNIEWLKADAKNKAETVWAPVETQYKAELERYNSQCDPAIVGNVDHAQLQRCDQWKAQIDRRKAEIEVWWKQYVADYTTKTVMPINQAIEKQKARMADLDRQMKANFKTFTEKQDRFLAIQSRVKE